MNLCSDFVKRFTCDSGGPTPESSIEFANSEKSNADVCLLRESPFRILRVAESGNVKEFQRIVSEDVSKLNIRDSRGRAAVHQATSRNHVNILQVLVAFEGDINLQDKEGQTAIHLAISTDSLEALEYLLLSGADARLMNEKLQSPLHLAVELNKPAALKIISRFKNAYDPNQAGQHGRTALHHCCILDHAQCLKILLYSMAASARIVDRHGFFAIHESAKHASSSSMELLLAWGEENGCCREEMISFFDSEGNVPLHSAIHGGDIQAVELCLRSGAKISTQQHDLSTPIHLASSQGALDMVKLMFSMQPEEKEKCLKSCDLQRMQPLHLASQFDHYALVDYLVSQGAHLNSLNKDRRSALHLAASRNAWRTMKTLIRLGADVSLRDKDARNVLHTLVIFDGELEKILDHEIAPLFIPILEDKDKSGNTALHHAVKRGHIKSVEKLLALGSSILTTNDEGENVFHVACRFGRLTIIRHILNMEQTNSVVNEGDGRGLTPLHIASAAGHLRVVQILMKKGALLHRDHEGRNPLHAAAQNGHRETMKLILSIHSHLIDQIDKDGNTPLHVCCMENQPSAVDLLLKLDCHLLYNFNGFSAVDFALHNKFVDVVHVMVTHQTRGDEVLSLTSGKYRCIMLAIVATMPTVASAVLSRCITSSKKSDSEFYHIKYDFKWLSILPEPVEDSKIKSKESETDGKLPLHETHLPILNGMVSYGRVDLLSHDLSQKYLQSKWNAYGKYFQLVNLLLYLLYLGMLTKFATSSYNKDDHHFYYRKGDLHHRQKNCSSSTQINNSFVAGSSAMMADCGGDADDDNSGNQIPDSETFLSILIVSISLFNIARECVNILRPRMLYTFNFENCVWWSMNVSTICMVILPRLNFFFEEPVQNPSASLSAFLCWFYLLVFLQRFDIVGIYICMFLEILYTLLRVLMIFSVLIVAFSLAFYILLSNGKHIAFENIHLSLIKTFTMMLGDVDFMNSFLYPHHCFKLESKYRLAGELDKLQEATHGECKIAHRLPHPQMSFFVLGVYVLLMPILLMNLLIGLAVGDIESVRQNAQLKRLTMQVELHTSLEKSLPMCIIGRVDQREVIEYPNARKAHLRIFDLERIFKYFQPKSPPKDDKRPRQSVDDVMARVEENGVTMTNLAFEMDNLKTLVPLVKQICHKLEISTDTDFIDEGSQLEEASLMTDLRRNFTRAATIRRTKRLPPQRSDSDVFL